MRFLILFFLGTATAAAETVTIDFEEWSGYQIINSFTTKGYDFESLPFTQTVIHEHRTMDFGWSNFGNEVDGVVITRQDGAGFWLNQFDAASFEDGGLNTYTEYRAVGTRESDGSLVTFTFDANGQYVTYAPEGLGKLSSLAFYSEPQVDGVIAGFHLDNIVMTTVPVPAAAWFFGSALAALGWVRRRCS